MVLIASLYVLVYFQSEEDHNTAWAPKIAVVFGLALTCLLVLMLPLDVANRSSGGGIPMDLLWQIMYISVAVMCIGVVPFLMFYYEAWDPESKNWQLWTAIKYELCTVFVVGFTLILMWLFVGWVPRASRGENKPRCLLQMPPPPAILLLLTRRIILAFSCSSRFVLSLVRTATPKSQSTS